MTPIARADVAAHLTDGTFSRARYIDYVPVRNLTLRLLERFPPDRYVYVGVGRAPTVLIALLEALRGRETARNLPLSGMRHLHPSRPEHYTPENLARLQRHLLEFLPDEVGTRKILFLDWGHYGFTLENLKREVERAAGEHPAFARAEYLALTDGSLGLPTRLEGLGIHSLECSPYERYLIDELYKDFSEYGQWPVHEPGVGAPKRRTRSALRHRMRHEYATLFMPGAKKDRHFRHARREFLRAYRRVRSYDDLVAMYAGKVAHDPVLRHLRENAGPPLTRPRYFYERAKDNCERTILRVGRAIF